MSEVELMIPDENRYPIASCFSCPGVHTKAAMNSLSTLTSRTDSIATLSSQTVDSSPSNLVVENFIYGFMV